MGADGLPKGISGDLERSRRLRGGGADNMSPQGSGKGGNQPRHPKGSPSGGQWRKLGLAIDLAQAEAGSLRKNTSTRQK